MTYQELYQILVEAEARRDDPKWPQDVRNRSAETVALVEERMRREGLTRQQLKRGY
jgi:hypothetical protein